MALEVIPRSKMTRTVVQHLSTISAGVNQVDKIGLAAFLSTYVWANKGVKDISSFIYSIAISLIVWSFMTVIIGYAARRFSRNIRRTLIPAVIIMSKGDERAFEKINANTVPAYQSTVYLLITVLMSVVINIASSYLYAYLTK